MTDKKDRLTTSAGAPVANNNHALTAGPRGPMLMQDVWFQEKLAHFDREVIPERRMHAKGSGAYGTFTVTHDVTRYTKASLFAEVGKQTEVFVRFSTVAGERGAADAERDIRGFAVKFYTDQGNWDMVGNNTPVFFLRDPLKFPDLNHVVKRNPRTNMTCLLYTSRYTMSEFQREARFFAELPVMPLREVVMLPRTIMPLFVGREASIKAIELAQSGYNKQMFLVAQREPDVEKPGADDLSPVGVVCKVLQMLRLPDGTIKVLFEGLHRARWTELREEDNCLMAMLCTVPESESRPEEREALVRTVQEALEEYAKNNKKLTQEALKMCRRDRLLTRFRDWMILPGRAPT